MAISATITRAFNKSGLNVSQTETVNGNGDDDRQVTVPAGAVNQLIAFAVTRAQMAAFCISSDKQAVTLKTNNATTPDDTLTITPNAPLLFSTTTGAANPFTHDITALYASNPGSTDTVLSILNVLNV